MNYKRNEKYTRTNGKRKSRRFCKGTNSFEKGINDKDALIGCTRSIWIMTV